MKDSEAEAGALITLKSYDSPEEFVARHLYGENNDPARIRNAVLNRLDRWEETNYGLPYGTRELQNELFLSRVAVHRTIDYLAGPGVGYISKSAAGNDEFNLKLNPAGVDYLASLNEVATLATSVFNQTSFDQAVFEGLTKVDPSLGRSYEQIVADLNDEKRKSWKGTANELRDTLSTLLRTLAPDESVTAQSKYVREKDTNGPTQRQRVEFILSARNAGSKELEVAKEVDQFEGQVGAFVRKFYARASNSAHRPTERKEVLKLHSYFVAFMRDLLDLET